MIKFAGISSDDCYVIVEHYPQRFFPKRKYNVQAIPGGDQDFIVDEGEDAFSNYTQPYSVFFDSIRAGLPQASRKIAEWLLRNPGYQRLEDTYDQEFYRMAYYSGGEQFLNFFNDYGRGTLTFTCAPKRFFKSGEIPIEVESGTKLFSPSSFRAYPIVKVTGSGDGTITITDKAGNEKNFTINGLDGEVTLYSREHKALNSSNESVNANVQSDYENLYLDTESTISFNSAISDLIVIPRWWTI